MGYGLPQDSWSYRSGAARTVHKALIFDTPGIIGKSGSPMEKNSDVLVLAHNAAHTWYKIMNNTGQIGWVEASDNEIIALPDTLSVVTLPT